jgi:hypothetical protein
VRRRPASLATLATVALAGCGSPPAPPPPPPVIRDSAAQWTDELARRRAATPPAPKASEPRTCVLSLGMTEEAVKTLLEGALVEPGTRTVGESVKDVYEVKFTDTVSAVQFKDGALIGWTGPATVAAPAAILALPQQQPVTVTLPAPAAAGPDDKTPIPLLKAP